MNSVNVAVPTDLQALFYKLQERSRNPVMVNGKPQRGLRRTEDLRPWCEEHDRNHATIVNMIRNLAKAGLIERTPEGRRPVWVRLRQEDVKKNWEELAANWKANSYEHKEGKSYVPADDDWR